MSAADNSNKMDLRRKRTLLILSSSLAFIAILVFIYFDYQKGQIKEVYINVFMCLVIVVGNICVFKYNLDRAAYFVGINLVNTALSFDVSIGAGDGGGLFWLPIMPLLIFFFLERIEAIFSAVFFFICSTVLLSYPNLFNTYQYDINTGIRYLIALFFINIIAYGLEASRYRYSKYLEESNNELKSNKEKLEEALSNVKTLSGLVPICANCKKIRDDSGYWNQIETYVQKHSEAEFSHGMCPDCSEEFYGDQNWYKKVKKKQSARNG